MTSMHTPQEWHGHSSFNMTQAQQTQHRANRQNDTSRRAHDETVTENLGRYNSLQGGLETKIADSRQLIDNLQRRVESLQNSIQKTNHSLGQLEVAYQAKEPQIRLCQWRMAQREKRPLREQVRDNPEHSLDDEKNTLVETQRRLADNMKKTQAIIRDLEDALAEVQHDLAHKQQALGIDESCLRNTQRSYQTASDSVRPHMTLTATVPAHKATNARLTLHETTRNEMNRQQNAHQLCQLGSNREQRAQALRDENRQLIARCQKMADDAIAKVERNIQERCAENQAMRGRLENEIRETLGEIERTKDTIAETKAQIRALDEPTDNANSCAASRRQRATREHIHDPVSTKIQEHQISTFRSHNDLTHHHAQEKAHLQDLNERLARLQEDHRDKTSSLHIDQGCLTHQTGHHHTAASSMPLNYSVKSRLSARRSDSGMGTHLRSYPMTAR